MFICLVLSNGGNGNNAACVFPFTYNQKVHYQCSHEKLSGSDTSEKRWCCTNSDCDADLKWGFCPEAKTPLKSDCVKDGYSSLDGGNNCYKQVLDVGVFLLLSM